MERDHLQGWKAIAGHLDLKPDAARHLARTQKLPVYKIGTKTVASSRTSIDKWRADREAASQRAREDAGPDA